MVLVKAERNLLPLCFQMVIYDIQRIMIQCYLLRIDTP